MIATKFDEIIVIASLSLLFALFGVLGIRDAYNGLEAIGEGAGAYTIANYHAVYLWHTKVRVKMALIDVSYERESAGNFEEEISEETNCLFYSTVPIGRYYITAYNHEETGSRRTASGTTCHEGTITTAAADVPKYLKFGDVIEVYVNGEPRLYVIEDTGRAVRKKHVDLYFESYKQMARYGSNYQNISRVEFPFGKPKYE